MAAQKTNSLSHLSIFKQDLSFSIDRIEADEKKRFLVHVNIYFVITWYMHDTQSSID